MSDDTMKARDTIRRRISELRRFIDDPASDRIAVHVAQSVEDSLRWAIEDTRGWPDAIEDVHLTAMLIRKERSDA